MDIQRKITVVVVETVSCSQGWPQTPYVNQGNTEILIPRSSPPEGIASMRHEAQL